VLSVEDWAEIRRLHRAERMPIKVIARVVGCSKNTVAVMTLDQYGHLFGDRLDVVADAMDAARAKALSDGHQTGTKTGTGRGCRFGNTPMTRRFVSAPGEIRTRAPASGEPTDDDLA
jgi:hypothetical protein